MPDVDARRFGELCLGVAKGEDVSALLATWRTTDPAFSGLILASQNNKVLPLAVAALQQAGALGSANLPPPSFWVSQNLLLRNQLIELNEALRTRQCTVLVLKGGIQLFRSAYARAGMRTMSDLDILIKDAEALTCFTDLGYQPAAPTIAMPTRLELEPGEHHLPPIKRPKDLVAIEPHILPATVENARLVGDLWARAELAPGLQSTYLPHPVDQLILAVVHALRHDRNSMHGGLFMRSLVECELLYAALSPSEQSEARDLMHARGAERLWTAWRGLADWCFRNDDAAVHRSIAARLLIYEYKLRSRSRKGALLASITHLACNFASRDFLESGRTKYFTRKVLNSAFWSRFVQKLLHSK
ncbi:nucleotidyltransferase family protein [Devosia sp. MC521]|uniref:nucleotidyltransferase family protein n=1 Tax=Devosia sp. MC521 TaxID=2759954 RepID=UPI0015F85979|nr:nucleotidyltransferase family protein [Devosia sp. MC521]MBJ6989238.1 nucleotidyltransferase family protein [Devosia sp. MC521]QMW63333.1 nucleotidyltransferase family protein [Devosia sp. MC521]